MTSPKSIALVDLSALFKTRYHGGQPSEAAFKVLSDLEALRATVGHVILCLDAQPYKRKEIYPEYKAQRAAAEPEELEQRRRLYDRAKSLGYQMAKVPGYEGDDVIATLARIYAERCAQVLIVGSDKDLAQCVTDNVLQWTGDGTARGPAEVKAKFEVTPEQIPLYLALVGDKSDNIPGVPGIGKVKASALAAEFKTLQGLKDGLVYRTSPNVPAKIWQALEGNWQAIELGVRLTTLNDRLPLDADALLAHVEPEVPAGLGFDAVDGESAFDQAMADYDPGTVGPTKMTQTLHDIAARGIEKTAIEEPERLTPAQRAHFDANQAAKAQANIPSNDGGTKVEETKTDGGKVIDAQFEPAKPAETTALVKKETNYGLVSDDLQPLDLRAARNISEYLFAGGMYAQKFKSALAIFTVILRARELGIGITTALANMHNLEGTIVMSADLIRAQCERHPDFEYLYPTKMSATICTWVGKNRRHPTPVEFSYTIEEARVAKLTGRRIWQERQQDMLNKTAGSKLARILFPGAVAGIYCPEEMAIDTVGQEVAA